MKVLDFGLAKAIEPAGAASPSSVAVADDHHARDDAGGHDPRHGRLHDARAGARQAGRQARRHLGVWRACSTRCSPAQRAFPGDDMTDTIVCGRQ